MTELAETAIQFTQAVLAIPYTLTEGEGLGQQYTPKTLTGEFATIHADTLVLTNSQWQRYGQPGRNIEEWGGEVRQRVLAEQPLQLRQLGRSLMRLHNRHRLPPVGEATGLGLMPFDEVAQSRNEDRLTIAAYLQACGYFGVSQPTAQLSSDTLGDRLVPRDALEYMSKYSPVGPVEDGQRTRTAVAKELGTTALTVTERVRAAGIVPMVRRRITANPWYYVEVEVFGPEDVAAVRSLLHER